MEPLAPSAPALCGSRRFENATASDTREGECGHQKETLQQRELPQGSAQRQEWRIMQSCMTLDDSLP